MPLWFLSLSSITTLFVMLISVIIMYASSLLHGFSNEFFSKQEILDKILVENFNINALDISLCNQVVDRRSVFWRYNIVMSSPFYLPLKYVKKQEEDDPLSSLDLYVEIIESHCRNCEIDDPVSGYFSEFSIDNDAIECVMVKARSGYFVYIMINTTIPQ